MIGGQHSHSHHNRRGTPIIIRRPFWLPASNYYVLAAAVSAAFFFLAWGIGHDQGEDTPWITAGIGASIILGGAVVVRFVLLRKMRERYTRIEPGLAQKYSGAARQVRGRSSGNKFTLERNAAILGEIKKKSDAANVLGKFSAGHREVFELCSEYINRTESELKNIAAGSPRFTALLKGRKSASNFHRYHMLQWAEIEARALTGEANSQTNLEEKVKAAKDALGVIDFALGTYPAEQNLVESRELLREMIVSIKVSDWVEKAERAAFKGDYREAVGLYRDALFYLGRDNVNSEQRQQAADHINAEIDRMRLLEIGE
ncbi:MAG: hypothetical protein ACKVRN_14770 [Pyrinomonadaceae bacterium]